ncbi:MAG: phage replisome organizer N-terminal domain-containing protein [Chloroflexota bacterium]|nr:phage replisome organizer N-terminal domain-containing protein [Chloroflexota bacterium]
MKWFRVYSEIKDDPKMLELDDHQFRLWINLLAMASEDGVTSRDTGVTSRGNVRASRRKGLAAALRTDVDALNTALDLFEELDMIEVEDDGEIITIAHWDARQYDKPSDIPEKTRERKRKSRSRENPTYIEESPSHVGHADVTPSHATYSTREYTDTDTEPEENEGRADALPPRPSDAAMSVADTLVTAAWVNGELLDVAHEVDRLFSKVPDYNVRDGPALAEVYVNWRGYVKKPPEKWSLAWLKWIRKEAADEQRDTNQPRQTGGVASARQNGHADLPGGTDYDTAFVNRTSRPAAGAGSHSGAA